MKKLIFSLVSIAFCLPVVAQSNQADELVFAPSLQLLSFTSSIQNHVVHLNWSTAWENDLDGFAVERAGNDMIFKVIGMVKSKGHPDKKENYDLIDNFPLEGQNYYRLKTTDLDGNIEYYPIINTFLERVASSNTHIYPKVVSTHYLRLTSETSVRKIRLFDLSGNMIYSGLPQENTNYIRIPKKVKHGAYLLVLLNDQGQQHQQQIMIL